MTTVAWRRRRFGGPRVALEQGPAGVWHPEELGVGGGLGEPIEAVEYLVDGQDLLDCVEVEGRDASERHLGHDPECAESDAGDV